LGVEIEHADKRAPIQIHKPFQVGASDTSAPAQPIAGVREDPLQLPADAQLAAKLYEQAAHELGAAVAQSFRGWRAELLRKAGQAESEPERANFYAIYVLTNPRRVSPQVNAALAEITSIPEASSALGR